MNYFYDMLSDDMRDIIYGKIVVKIQKVVRGNLVREDIVNSILDLYYESSLNQMQKREREEYIDVCGRKNMNYFMYLSKIYKTKKITTNIHKWQILVQEIWYGLENEMFDLCHPRQIEYYNNSEEAFWILLFALYNKEQFKHIRMYLDIGFKEVFMEGAIAWGGVINPVIVDYLK